jgi:hypothetical protein
MNNEIFYNISKIIERDKKATTYKFALLRGVIEIIQENSPFINFSEHRVFIPTGLLIEKWLLYYYPIFQSQTPIPQINGNSKLKFENKFKKIIQSYQLIGGFSVFYNDLKRKGIPKDLHTEFRDLANMLFDRITLMPMKYLGQSVYNDHYMIFKPESGVSNDNQFQMDLQFLISNFGTFSIPVEYYEAFKLLGSFINGQDSLLIKWADFSVNASKGNLSIEKVVNEVLKSPITKRESDESIEIYNQILIDRGRVECVWTGEEISVFDVDHLIPFSIWKNNDLWNLLPSKPITNNKKRDKIPSPEFIEERKKSILNYWELLNLKQSIRFKKEIKVALLGNSPFDSWQQSAIDQLKSSCSYLINNRGYEEWKI